MIQEEHVSFETAKLLKIKKFDFPCMHVYQDNGNFISLHTLCGWRYACNSELVAEYSAPTQAVAMRYLREVHNLFIELKVSKNTFLWGYRVSNPNGSTSCLHASTFNTFEEACEAAIKYYLENLIKNV